jgi:hypothetical protein
MFSIYKEIRNLGALFAEYPTNRGRRFIDAYREDGELFVWVGRLHLIATSARRIARQATSTAAAAFTFVWCEASALTSLSSLMPAMPKASAAALMAVTAATATIEAASDEALTAPPAIEETAAWLSSPASDFPEAFVSEATATSSR